MDTRIVVVLTVLALLVASAASATSLSGLRTISGDLTTYTYTVSSTEVGDYITSVHIYAPLSTELIRGYTAPPHWSFHAATDPDPNVGTDISWYADDYDLYGIANLGSAVFTLTVPSWTNTETGHIVPGCFGNWGYETQSWATLISFPSVPVPEGVPEPTSLITLMIGCVIATRARWRRAG